MKKMGMMFRATTARPWILANNPGKNDVCQCFKDKVPNNKWVVINRFKTSNECRKLVTKCSEFFMMMPLMGQKVRGMGMMMGMMR